MRLPIISDTTRGYTVVFNPYDEDPDESSYGYWVCENCPVDGTNLILGPFETFDEARQQSVNYILDMT